MAAAVETPKRKTSISRTRPSAHVLGTPTSPHTPLRSSTSVFGSPNTSFRSDDDPIIFEIGSRFLRGGFPGENSPRCIIGFGPDEQRRAGDYRQWMSGYSAKRKKRKVGLEWGEDYELWNMNVPFLNIGLVEDKLERALREAYTKWFILDPKPKKVILVLPSIMPRPLLSSVLTTLFNNFLVPSITAFSSPVLSTAAAGLRSGMIVDIGWTETTMTAVYEFREILHKRTIRAGKLLSQEMASMLTDEATKHYSREDREAGDEVSFEEADEVLVRTGWCMNREQAASVISSPNSHPPRDDLSTLTSIPLTASNPPITLALPFYKLALPTETALFGSGTPPDQFDLEEFPLDTLAYNTLFSLPTDIRKSCMSRIIITGGVSHLPGIKSRLVSELQHLFSTRGWNPVRNYGSAPLGFQKELRNKSNAYQAQSILNGTTKITDASPSAALMEPEIDPIEEKLRQQNNPHKGSPTPHPDGVIRGVESLGPWVGASLLGALKIKGVVEIEREKFLQHGLAGATRDKEINYVTQRQSMGPGLKPVHGERSSWTLGNWA